MQSPGDVVVDDFANLNISDDISTNGQEDASRKLFVGGLSWMTTEDGLRHYFESLNLGVDRVIIMRDKMTGRSRGFGFVTLSTTEDVDKSVRTNLYLDGRKVEAKRAIPKRDMDNHAKKIFVGGIPISLSNTEFRKYFEEFGKVLETQVMTDRESGRSRGFGFVTYEEEKIAEKVLKTVHTIHGKPVEVKRAEPKKVEQPQPVHIMHVNPVTAGAVYVPHAFPYPGGAMYHGHQAVYTAPMAYDPAYFVPTQGGLVYLPQHYEPLDTDLYSGVHQHVPSHSPYSVADTYDPKFESPLSRRGTTNNLPVKVPTTRESSTRDTDSFLKVTVSPIDKQDGAYTVPTYSLKTEPYNINLSPFPAVRFSEPRTERAFSAGFVNDTITLTAEGAFRPKLIPSGHLDARKKRAGSQPATATIKRRGSQPPSVLGTRRTDLNWRHVPVSRKSPGNDSSSYSSGIHKYFQ